MLSKYVPIMFEPIEVVGGIIFKPCKTEPLITKHLQPNALAM